MATQLKILSEPDFLTRTIIVKTDETTTPPAPRDGAHKVLDLKSTSTWILDLCVGPGPLFSLVRSY